MSDTDSHRIFAGIGEVLSDVFEDGRQALGGAPRVGSRPPDGRLGSFAPPATPVLPDSIRDYVRHATSARPAV